MVPARRPLVGNFDTYFTTLHATIMIYLTLYSLFERITVSPKEEVLSAVRAIELQFVVGAGNVVSGCDWDESRDGSVVFLLVGMNVELFLFADAMHTNSQRE